MISVLYVDDESDLCELGKIFLEQHREFSVTTFTSAQDALGSGNVWTSDAIISDYQMPGMDGIEFLREVRSRSREVPFILFTGRGREEVVIDAINNGADFYLQKGGDPTAQFAELAHKIRIAVERRQAKNALKDSEKRLADIINFLPDATFAIDRSGRIIAWNRAIEEMTGVSSDEMVGKQDHEYGIPFYGERRPLLIDLVFRQDDAVEENYPFVQRKEDKFISEIFIQRLYGGRGAHLWFIASPLYDAEGAIVGAVESIRDITDRKRAENALSESEQRLNDIINFLPDATLAIDRTGTVISWNRAIEEMTGVPAAEMLGKGNYEYALPFYQTRRKILIDLIFESDEVIARNYAHIFHEKDTLIAETSLPRPKGHAAILMGKASPLYNRQGEIVGAIESIRDITGLRKAEEMAAHTRKDWETIFRAIGHPAIVLDANNHITDANDAMIRISGMSLDQLRQKRCYDIFHGKGMIRPPASCPFEQLKRDKTPEAAEAEIEALGGIYHVSCTPVFNERGGLEKVIHIAMDITERRRAQDEIKTAYEQIAASEEELRGQFETLVQNEQQIRESEAKYRELAELLPQAVFEMDLQFQITYANRYALAAFGLTERDLLAGANALKMIATDDHGRIRENIGKILTGEPYDDHEYTAIRSDGSSFPALIYSAPIYRSGQLAGLRGILIDITSRKKTEADLRESRERLMAFMDSATDAFTIWDADLNLLDLNKAALSYLPPGTRKEEVLGRNFQDFLPDPRSADHVARYQEVIRTGIPFSGTEELSMAAQYGRHWHTVKAFRVGSGLGLVTSDITLQKRAEENLREREAVLSGIFRVAPVGILMVKNRIILQVNEKICSISGYAEADLNGKDTRFLYPEDRDYEFVGKVRYAKGQMYGLDAVETRWVKKDGSIRNILLSGIPLDPLKPEDVWIVVVLDITETRQAEEELRLLKISVDRAYDEVFWMDFSGRILYVNDAACRITGYTREEFRAMKIFELDPDFPPNIWEASVADLRERKTQFITTRHRCKDGRIIDVEIVTVYVNKEGKEYSFAFVRDITERKRMEREILEKQQQLNNFMQSLPVGVFRTSRRSPGRRIMANPILARMLGYDSLEEFMQSPLDESYADPSVRKTLMDGLEQDGIIANAEFQLKKKNGELLWVSMSAVGVPGQDGSPEYLDGVITDISDRKQAEEILRESKERIQLALDGGGLGTWNWNVQSGEVIFNERWAEMLGYRVGEIEPHVRSRERLVHPDDMPQVQKLLADHLEGRSPGYEVEHRLRHKNGSWIWVLDKGRVIRRDMEGRPLLAAGTHLDITRRKLAEETLHETNRRLKLLNSITRHDIRNQLMALKGFVEVASARGTDMATMGYLEKISAITDTITRHIEFTRAYQELGINLPAWFRLDETVSRTKDNFPVIFSDTCPPVEIYADPMLEKVFYNIFDNALRHGGTVTAITISCKQEGDILCIVVEDDGQGIPAIEKKKIFERGYGRNSGLGLFLAREILAITGITIRENGTPGKGARFEIGVPDTAYRRV